MSPVIPCPQLFSYSQLFQLFIKDKGQGLDVKKKKEFEEFVSAYASEIVEKWIDYFVKKKPIVPKVITQKVKNVRIIG